ncbi:hypothetical protein ACN4EG_21095 [Alkalinema pantanalense CENA528]|uniref:hypothetical protein n=1 Tax=Alkalinema pantanalense TaxID=1620705 RepID=UPI003D6FEEF4
MAQVPPPSRPPNSLAIKTEKVVSSVLEPIDVLGEKLMGDLWRTFYLSVQDAIGLACLVQIPSFIGKVIIGKEFSSFQVCLQEDPFGPNRYACFIIVISDFCLWAILAGRILTRFVQDCSRLFKQGGNKNVSKP